MLKKLDKGILYTSLLLVFVGFLIFFSVSLKKLNNPEFFTSIFISQVIAITVGLIIMFLIATSQKISKTFFRYKSGYIFIGAIFLQLSLFVPNLGVSYQGSLRWLDFGFFNIQPSEFLKIALILFFAAITTTLGKKLKKLKNYFLLVFIFILPIFLFYFYIRDWGTMITLILTMGIILFLSETKLKHLFASFLLGITILFSFLWFFVPHAQERIANFINPETADSLGSFYQNEQMLITIGSGEIYGRGFGSSLQKFSGLLPEPLGDSIFAIYAEETGFIGSTFLILIFLLLIFFIFKKARNLKSIFEKKVVTGLSLIIFFPAFFNIAATMSLVPLSGIPIPLISKGGSVALATLISLGIILYYTRKNKN